MAQRRIRFQLGTPFEARMQHLAETLDYSTKAEKILGDAFDWFAKIVKDGVDFRLVRDGGRFRKTLSCILS